MRKISLPFRFSLSLVLRLVPCKSETLYLLYFPQTDRFGFTFPDFKDRSTPDAKVEEDVMVDGVEVGFVIEKEVGELLDSHQKLSCEQLCAYLNSRQKEVDLLCRDTMCA